MYLDSPITLTGVYQITETAKWLAKEFDFTGWKGIVSPYLRTLQTAAFLQKEIPTLKFEVDSCAGEYYVNGFPEDDFAGMNNGVITIPNRVHEFSQFDGWSTLTYQSMYGKEEFSCLLERLYHLNKKLVNGKYLVVTHACPAHVLSDICMGRPVEWIKSFSYNFRDVKNSSITYVKDDNKVWFSKIVYDIEHNPLKAY